MTVPLLRVDLAAPVAPELKAVLLRRTAALFAEITESPVDRIRTQVHELPADSFAVGGIPIKSSEARRRNSASVHRTGARPATGVIRSSIRA